MHMYITQTAQQIKSMDYSRNIHTPTTDLVLDIPIRGSQGFLKYGQERGLDLKLIP